MLGCRGVRTRASWSRALATSTTHPPPGGFWQQWQRELDERRELWEEAQQRLRVERAAQNDEWDRIRAAWKEGAKELPPRERVRFWFEPGGTYRAATPEQASAWQQQYRGSGADKAGQSASSAPAPGDKRGFYAALGLVTAESRRADAAALQAAFRRTVLDNHPDMAPDAKDDEARTRRFRAAVAAWEVLRDKAQRERYDRE